MSTPNPKLVLFAQFAAVAKSLAHAHRLELLEQLAQGEGAMVDKGYVGVKNYYPDVPVVIPFKASRGHPLTAEQQAANRVISGYRVVIEHVMAQLNRFQVLKQVFRSAFERHTGVIRVVAALVDRRIATVPLKTYAVN